MIVKPHSGVRRVAFVRKPVKTDSGEIEIVLTSSQRASRRLHRRFKHISKAMECGRETGYVDDLQLVHRLDRRHMAAELKELVQSGGHQEDIVKTGKLVPFQIGKSKGRSRAVLVDAKGQFSFVY